MGNNSKPERVMIIVAHPDDPDFGAGGTTGRWVRDGVHVTVLRRRADRQGGRIANGAGHRCLKLARVPASHPRRREEPCPRVARNAGRVPR